MDDAKQVSTRLWEKKKKGMSLMDGILVIAGIQIQ